MKRHSLLFGVQDYPGTGSLEQLTAPAADVDALAEVVGDPRYMGEVGKVRPYKDLRLADARQKFGEFFEGIDREDVVLVYFSGHGLRDLDAIGHLYLCFTDTDENKLDLTAQRVSEIGEWLDRRGFQRTLIVLDCCYSGAAGEQLTKGSLTAQLQAIEQPHADGTGRYVLSSSGRATASLEKKSLGRSVFTHHLIEGIRTGAADTDRNGKISVSEISAYLSDKVPKDAIGQLPELSSRKTSGTFIVAHNLRIVEERERERAAAAAAVRAREREALTGAVVSRLREQVNSGGIDMDFAGSVESWLDAHPADAADHPRLALLRDFTEGRLSAVRFHVRWLAADAPQGRPSGAAPKATVEPVHTAADAEPTVSVEPPTKQTAVGPEPARPVSATTAASDGETESRRVVPTGLWWRLGITATCYVAGVMGLRVLGLILFYTYDGYIRPLPELVLPGAVAGALAFLLCIRFKWRGLLASLAVLVATHVAFLGTLFSLDGFDWVMSIESLVFGGGGFLGAWFVLGALRGVRNRWGRSRGRERRRPI